MDKLSTLIVVLVALASLSGLATAANAARSAESNSTERVALDKTSIRLLRAEVTEVNDQAVTFAAAVEFSAAALSELPKVGEIIDITYSETPGGLRATTVKSSKSNSSYRVAVDRTSLRLLRAEVTEVNDQAVTFAATVEFSAATLSELPKVGEIIDIAYSETPGGLRATTVRSGKSNSSFRVAVDRTSLRLLKAEVTEVNDQAVTFAAAVEFSAAALSELPKVGEIIDITYSETPGGLRATTVRSGKSNSSERVAVDRTSLRLLKAEVTEVNDQAVTFAATVEFSAAALSELPKVGEIIDITYSETPDGGPLRAANLNFSKSNIN